MKVITYEGTVENGQIRFSEPVSLPEKARVFVVIPETGIPRAHVRSPGSRTPSKRLTSRWKSPRMPAYDDDGFAPAAPVARVVLRHPDTGQGVTDLPQKSPSPVRISLVNGDRPGL